MAVPVRMVEPEPPGVLARLARAVCPACGSPRAVRSQRRTAADHVLGVLGLRPFRCLSCRWRFHAWPSLRLLTMPIPATDRRAGGVVQK